MNQAAPDILQVRLDSLASLYSRLAAALGEAGFSGNQLNEIFSKHVRAECVQCGIQISGDDIGHIAFAEEKTPLPNSKLDRLRHGYCVRNGCDSYFYRLHFGDYPGLNWKEIWEKADRHTVAAEAAREKATLQGSNTFHKWLLTRVCVGVAVVLVLLLFWHIRYYGYVPLLQKPHKYTIDPGSVDNRPSR
ncbi:MAG TPA: hypothetical protein VEL06_18415 [Haliangiales bacterium]|nr:hypothetical protein [Haliangiales bacterium]